MPPSQDVTGKRFGKLTALHKEYKHPTQGTWFWKCKCDCGNTTVVRLSKLNNGWTKSCGCAHGDASQRASEKWHEERDQDPYLTHKVHSVKHNARTGGRELSLSPKQICALVTSPCFYCESLEIEEGLVRRFKGKKSWIKPTNGVDRIDSEGGYTLDNVRPCCANCNYAKRRLTDEEFYSHIDKLHKNLVKKGLIKG